MRLFVALDIDHNIRQRISEFMGKFRALAPDVRWVSPESLHVTLKFIGERPDTTVKGVEDSLRTVSSNSFPISFGGSGFFPAERSARVFWIGIKAGPALAKLSGKIEEVLVPLGIAKEKRAFNPHLTLARGKDSSGAPGWRKSDRPNRQFASLQETLCGLDTPEFGSMAAKEFFLYRSQLSSSGAQYTQIARFPLDEA